MQVRMMKLMPIMFTVLFLFFPAGLVLYWLVNNLLSLAQQTYADEVRMEEQLWMQRGIQSVPTFVIGNQGVAGAQPPETLAAFIQEAILQEANGN